MREHITKWSHGDPIPDGAREAVAELLEQGFRKKQIAIRTGLSLNLVRVLVDGPKTSARFPSIEARREAVQNEVEQGHNLKEIIANLNLPESVVRADIRYLGIDINSVSNPYNEETDARKVEILDRHFQGMSAADIAAELAISRWQVIYAINSNRGSDGWHQTND